MLSSTPKNRKRRVRRKKNTLDQWETPTPASKKARNENSPSETYQKLHAQIGVIESFLEKRRMAEAQQLKMRQQNILPPPDRAQKRRAARSMSLAERRRYHAARNRSSFKFLLLFSFACGIAWWLLFSGV